MNKLQIDKDCIIELTELDYEIEIIKNCQLKLIINDSNKSHLKMLIKDCNVDIDLILNNNSDLLINQLGIDSSINYHILMNDNSKLFVVDSIMSFKESINTIKIIHEGNNSNTRFYTNGINLENNKMYYYLDGIISKNVNGVFLEENSKIINIMTGDSKILPNLVVDTKEVIANNSA